jgi:hypothetical protein
MLVALLLYPERFAHDPDATVAHVVVPMAYVVAGVVGMVGLVRVLTLPRRQRPRSHRWFTIAMVAVGLAALAIFNVDRLVRVFADPRDTFLSAGFVVYVALPFIGSAWLLAKSWEFLLADRGGAKPCGDDRAGGARPCG